MDDPVPELEVEAQELRQRMWVAAQMWDAGKANRLPDILCDQLVIAWFHSTLADEMVPFFTEGGEDE